MPKHELDPERRAFLKDEANALDPIRRRLSLFLGPLAMVPGVFMMLVGFNVIHVASRSGHLPLVIFAAFGATVFLGGTAAFLQGLGLSSKSALNRLLGTFIFGGMSFPFIWLLFLNNQIPESTKFILKVILGVIVILFVFFFFARFIPGVRVVSDKPTRAIGQSKKGWEDE